MPPTIHQSGTFAESGCQRPIRLHPNLAKIARLGGVVESVWLTGWLHLD
jgi:hypothetical protein